MLLRRRVDQQTCSPARQRRGLLLVVVGMMLSFMMLPQRVATKARPSALLSGFPPSSRPLTTIYERRCLSYHAAAASCCWIQPSIAGKLRFASRRRSKWLFPPISSGGGGGRPFTTTTPTTTTTINKALRGDDDKAAASSPSPPPLAVGGGHEGGQQAGMGDGVSSDDEDDVDKRRHVKELQALSAYFYRPDKDNTTVYFYARADCGSVVEAVAAESREAGSNFTTEITLERAQKLHDVGAVYRLDRDNKFRRTCEEEEGRKGGNPVRGKVDGFRVYLYPRAFPACYVSDYPSRITYEDDDLIIIDKPAGGGGGGGGDDGVTYEDDDLIIIDKPAGGDGGGGGGDGDDGVTYEDDDLIIIDKPAGCPCSPHVSNSVDCLDVTFGASTGRTGLIRLNRLDTVTTGLVAIGKTPKGASKFQEELRMRRIDKVYRALLEGPIPTGRLIHYMAQDVIHRRPAPRAISAVQHPGWKDTVCNVISCTPIPVQDLTLDDSVVVGDETQQVYYEVVVELITGRTHQLRAQFAAEGAAIVGDCMYRPMARYLLNDLDDPAIHELYPLCLEPKGREGVALQCWKLKVMGIEAQAGDPWWRKRR